MPTLATPETAVIEAPYSGDVLHVTIIKSALTWGQARKVKGFLSMATKANSDSAFEETAEAATKLLVTVAKEWDLKDDSGAMVPINEETVDQLPIETASGLIEALGKLMGGDADADKKSGAGNLPGSHGQRAAARSSRRKTAK